MASSRRKVLTSLSLSPPPSPSFSAPSSPITFIPLPLSRAPYR
jgi:hypothetical protein